MKATLPRWSVFVGHSNALGDKVYVPVLLQTTAPVEPVATRATELGTGTYVYVSTDSVSEALRVAAEHTK